MCTPDNPRYILLSAAVLGVATLTMTPGLPAGETASSRLNILLITADDMNWDSPGCFGGRTPDITPHIDHLASEGMRFKHAHVTAAVCTPCRSVLLTGCYPHRNGAEGFQRIKTEIPTLSELLHNAGYHCGIIGKPLGQQEKFKWSSSYAYTGPGGEKMSGRDPNVYYQFAKRFFQEAAAKRQPFFLMANPHDPHRPFHGSNEAKRRFTRRTVDVAIPSRIYRPEEIHVPGFLPDLPTIREEVAQYYSSVRRCDDSVGAILAALRESGQEANTLVTFLSDNGASFPFAKTNCYLHSTRTPWIVRWPGKIKPDVVDDRHLISTIDFMPTVLEAAGLSQPEGMDGFSFVPILLGGRQEGRDYVFTQFHHIHGRRPYPIRCVQNARFGYIFNAWSNGQRVYDAEPLSGLTFKAMQTASETNPDIAARVRMLQYRTVEEFYDFENDPDALHNLIDDPRHKQAIKQMKTILWNWMKCTDDPALEAFENLQSPEALEQFMKAYSAKAAHEIEDLKAYEARTGYRF